MANDFNDLKGLLFLVLLTIPLTTTTNIDCNEKPFYCVNATHFMICVDIGGGVSKTIDDFTIQCPPTTVCLPTNRFECEFPPPLDVIGVSTGNDKSVSPPIIDSITTVATIKDITKTKITEQNASALAEVFTPKLVELLEDLKEEYGGGYRDVTTILPSTTLIDNYNLNVNSTVNYKAEEIVTNTDKEVNTFEESTILPSTAVNSDYNLNYFPTTNYITNGIVTNTDKNLKTNINTEITTEHATSFFVTDNLEVFNTTVPEKGLLNSISKESNKTFHQVEKPLNIQQEDSFYMTTTDSPSINIGQSFDFNVTSDNTPIRNHSNDHWSLDNNNILSNVDLSKTIQVTKNSMNTSENVSELSTSYIESTTLNDNNLQSVMVQNTAITEKHFALTTEASIKTKIVNNQAFEDVKAHRLDAQLKNTEDLMLAVSKKTANIDFNSNSQILNPLEKQEFIYNSVREDVLIDTVKKLHTKSDFITNITSIENKNNEIDNVTEVLTTTDTLIATTIHTHPKNDFKEEHFASMLPNDIKLYQEAPHAESNIREDKTQVEGLNDEIGSNKIINNTVNTIELTDYKKLGDRTLKKNALSSNDTFTVSSHIPLQYAQDNIINNSINTNEAINELVYSTLSPDKLTTELIQSDQPNEITDIFNKQAIETTTFENAALNNNQSVTVSSKIQPDFAEEGIVNDLIGYNRTENKVLITTIYPIETTIEVYEGPRVTINVLDRHNNGTLDNLALNQNQAFDILSNSTIDNAIEAVSNDSSGFIKRENEAPNEATTEAITEQPNRIINILLKRENGGSIFENMAINSNQSLFDAKKNNINETISFNKTEVETVDSSIYLNDAITNATKEHPSGITDILIRRDNEGNAFENIAINTNKSLVDAKKNNINETISFNETEAETVYSSIYPNDAITNATKEHPSRIIDILIRRDNEGNAFENIAININKSLVDVKKNNINDTISFNKTETETVYSSIPNDTITNATEEHPSGIIDILIRRDNEGNAFENIAINTNKSLVDAKKNNINDTISFNKTVAPINYTSEHTTEIIYEQPKQDVDIMNKLNNKITTLETSELIKNQPSGILFHSTTDNATKAAAVAYNSNSFNKTENETVYSTNYPNDATTKAVNEQPSGIIDILIKRDNQGSTFKNAAKNSKKTLVNEKRNFNEIENETVPSTVYTSEHTTEIIYEQPRDEVNILNELNNKVTTSGISVTSQSPNSPLSTSLESAKDESISGTIGLDKIVYSTVYSYEPTIGISYEQPPVNVDISNGLEQKATTVGKSELENDKFSGDVTSPMSHQSGDVYMTTSNTLDDYPSTTSTPSYDTTSLGGHELMLDNISKELNATILLLGKLSETMSSLALSNHNTNMIDTFAIKPPAINDEKVAIVTESTASTMTEIVYTPSNPEEKALVPQYATTINTINYYEEATFEPTTPITIREIKDTMLLSIAQNNNITQLNPKNKEVSFFATTEQSNASKSKTHIPIKKNEVNTKPIIVDIIETNYMTISSTLNTSKTTLKDDINTFDTATIYVKVHDSNTTNSAALSKESSNINTTENTHMSYFMADGQKKLRSIKADYIPDLEPSSTQPIEINESKKIKYGDYANAASLLKHNINEKSVMNPAETKTTVVTNQSEYGHGSNNTFAIDIKNTISESTIVYNLTPSTARDFHVNNLKYDVISEPKLLNNNVALKDSEKLSSQDTKYMNGINIFKTATEKVMTTVDYYDNYNKVKYFTDIHEENTTPSMDEINVKISTNIDTDYLMPNIDRPTETNVGNEAVNSSPDYITGTTQSLRLFSTTENIQTQNDNTSPKIDEGKHNQNMLTGNLTGFIETIDNLNVTDFDELAKRKTLSVVSPNLAYNTERKNNPSLTTDYMKGINSIVETVSISGLNESLVSKKSVINPSNSLLNISFANITTRKEAPYRSTLNLTLKSVRPTDLNNREDINLENENNVLIKNQMNIETGDDKEQNSSREAKYESSTTYFEIPSQIEITSSNPLTDNKIKTSLKDIEHKFDIETVGDVTFNLMHTENKTTSHNNIAESRITTTSGNTSKYNYNSANKIVTIFVIDNEQSNNSKASGIRKPKMNVRQSFSNKTEHHNIISDKSSVNTQDEDVSNKQIYQRMYKVNKSTATNTQDNIASETTSGKNKKDKPSQFDCGDSTRGKYADSEDCRKFYICIGKLKPIVGTCPNNTVFSEINKQCTRNLSHCVRNNQFHCLYEGRFGDFLKDDTYYICKKHNSHFLRYKLQCQVGYHLNKSTVKCEKNVESSSQSTSSISENSQVNDQNGESVIDNSKKSDDKTDFECKKEGKFPHPKDCRKYYVCSKNRKHEYRRKVKKCSDEEVYDKERKKCTSAESNEC